MLEGDWIILICGLCAGLIIFATLCLVGMWDLSAAKHCEELDKEIEVLKNEIEKLKGMKNDD